MHATAPPARYDLPWKAVLSHAFRPFMDFYFPDFSANIDWRQRPRFRDKELSRFGFGAKPNVMVADKLAEAQLHNGQKVLIHIEIQAQRDATLPRRMYDYHSRINQAYGLRVASLALLADEHPGWRPPGFRLQLGDTIAEFSFGSAKLLDHLTDMQALEASHNTVAWLTLAHFRSQQAHHDADALYAAKLHLTRLLFQHRWSQKRIIVLFNAINLMMALPESHDRRYGLAIDRLEKEHGMKNCITHSSKCSSTMASRSGRNAGCKKVWSWVSKKELKKGSKEE